MAASKTTKEILELGKVLVSELKLEDSRDTLAKWLAHHVAELIVSAEKEQSPARRKKAAEQAVDTIVRIWSQRDHLPGNANPFAPYRSILQILSALTASDGSWRANTPDHPITNLYRRFPRLVRALLVLQLPRSGKGSRKARQIVHQFLEADESRLLHQFQIRFRIIGVDGEDTDKDAEPKDEFARAERLAEMLIKETIQDLNKVRESSIIKAAPLKS
jgi:hypothetical protein